MLTVKPLQNVIACLMLLASFSGCKSEKADASKERLTSMAGGKLKTVVPVKGVVKVDGTPAAGVNLFLYREGEVANPIGECRTDQDGKYCWTTYTACDGLEAGSYLVGFTHIPKPKKNDTGVDLFKGKFKNPQKNKIEFKIELKVDAGAAQDKADYELATK